MPFLVYEGDEFFCIQKKKAMSVCFKEIIFIIKWLTFFFP